jgi:hypothetical protein
MAARDYSATASYFEGRAKRARHESERERFLRMAQTYRELAADASDEARSAQKPHMPEERAR